MRIFFLYNEIVKKESDLIPHIRELYTHLAREHDVILFAPRPGEGAVPGDRRVYIRAGTVPIISSLLFQLLLLAALVSRSRREGKPDAMYSRHNMYNLAPRLASRVLGVPYVLEENGLGADEVGWKGIQALFRPLIRLTSLLDFRGAAHIVAVTPGIRQALIDDYGIPGAKITVIENGANTDLFRPVGAAQARAVLGMDPAARVVCFAGTLYPYQGVDSLIRAAPLVLAKDPSVLFLVVGDGPMLRESRELAGRLGVAGSFRFTGRVPYEQVPLHICAADLCVAPKKPILSGYSPLKLYEYMACGRPVIATRTAGFEVLEAGQAGVLVDPENPGEFGAAMNRLLGDPALGERMGRNGRRCVEEKRNWAGIAAEIGGILASTVRLYHPGGS
ncbi:MAG TPA: glycosyltransferase family 4 protein [Methanomicrobiales archaeon]|nr:glycosyltransferase family 4 protein [Methanomicrobiales archaeon]